MKYCYLISSCQAYKETFLVDCVSSIIASGISPLDIYCFIGGSAENRYETAPSGCHYYYVDHNSFDPTALIGYFDNIEKFAEYDQLFLLHDTTVAGPQFKTLVEAQQTEDYISVGGIMTMGLIHPKFLETYKDEILGLRNCTKYQACVFEVVLYRRTGKVYPRDYPDEYIKGEIEETRNGPRRVVFYRCIDLKKMTVNLG